MFSSPGYRSKVTFAAVCIPSPGRSAWKDPAADPPLRSFCRENWRENNVDFLRVSFVREWRAQHKRDSCGIGERHREGKYFQYVSSASDGADCLRMPDRIGWPILARTAYCNCSRFISVWRNLAQHGSTRCRIPPALQASLSPTDSMPRRLRRTNRDERRAVALARWPVHGRLTGVATLRSAIAQGIWRLSRRCFLMR